MTNTEYLYNAMKQYQQARSAARAEFIETMKPLESAKGTPYYSDKRDTALRKREEAVKAAQDEARRVLSIAVNCMRNAISSRKMVPPTEEQLRILQMLNMRDKVSRAELDTAANAMDGNGSALALLSEIADKNDIPVSYDHMSTTGLAANTAERLVLEIRAACVKRINDTVGARHSSVLAADYYARNHGNSYNPDDLPQEAPYESEEEFYSGITSIPFNIVSKSLN